MSAPAQPSTGPINDQDVNEWKIRLNEVLAKPGEVVNSKSPESAQPWYESFFGCFSPIDLCCMTYCLPCVTFGKTHHRLRKDANLVGYEPINTSVCQPFHADPLPIARRYANDDGLIVHDPLRLSLRRPPLGASGHAACRYPGQVQPSGQLPD